MILRRRTSIPISEAQMGHCLSRIRRRNQQDRDLFDCLVEIFSWPTYKFFYNR
jgi:hypothetical protein